LAKSFDRIAERFDETRSYPDAVMSRIVDAVEKAMAPCASVLDDGVGTGRFAMPLQRRGFDVVGIDVARLMLQKAADKGVGALVRGDACALPFRDGSFDYALSVHLIHLIPAWRSALREVGRVTRTSLLSVVSDKGRSEVEEIRRMYAGTCKDLGFEVRHAGPMERELVDLIQPDSVTVITVQEKAVDVGTLLNNYEARTFSEQWEVPEEVHSGAVQILKERYEGIDSILSREEISLMVWSADRIRGVGRPPA
jgi:ubiquinone/menaquinone biosynthesis C-methylase UbiE